MATKKITRASKEECREARDGLTRLVEASPSLQSPKSFGKEIQQLFNFLLAAERKLPTEAAFERDQIRNKEERSPR